MLESDLQTTSRSLELELSKGAEQEEELQVLRNCLQQVIEKAGPQPDGEEGVDGGEEEGRRGEGEEEGEVRASKETQLKKIEAMLDTTKVSLLCPKVFTTLYKVYNSPNRVCACGSHCLGSSPVARSGVRERPALRTVEDEARRVGSEQW